MTEARLTALLLRGAPERAKGRRQLVYRSLLGEWLPQSGWEPGGSMGFEAYYTGPAATPPEELLTEIFTPLKPR